MKAYEKMRMPHIIFGSGSTNRTASELDRLSVKKCLIVSGRSTSQHPITLKILQSLTDRNISYDIYNGVSPEPRDIQCIQIASIIKAGDYDCVIGIGGGSPMDAAKAAAMIAGIPEEITDLHEYGKSGTKMKDEWSCPCRLVMIPTTSGTGAEVSPSSVITSTIHGVKFSFLNESMVPDLCIIDPEYTLGMPARSTILGGLDAFCHAVENLVGIASSEYTDLILLSCVERIWKYLPVAVQNPDDLDAREQLSWAAHNAQSNGGIPNGHAVAHAVGATYHIAHGHACIMVLPTVIRHFADDSKDIISSIAERIGLKPSSDAKKNAAIVADAILDFYKRAGLKPLKETLVENGVYDDEETFIRKLIPSVMDDFKSRFWLPPIHTGDYEKKIGAVLASIYEEK